MSFNNCQPVPPIQSVDWLPIDDDVIDSFMLSDVTTDDVSHNEFDQYIQIDKPEPSMVKSNVYDGDFDNWLMNYSLT